MDKPKRNHTITIKLNGENKTFQNEMNETKSKAETPSIPKVVKIHPDLPDEVVIHETAAAEEQVDESFDWIIPESTGEEMEGQSPVSKSGKSAGGSKAISFSDYSKKKSGRTLRSILIAATFAVLVGTAIGLFMLKLVMTESRQKSGTQQPPAVETNNQKTPESSKVVTINSISTYVIQGGIFTTKNGAEVVSNQLSKNGIPSQMIDIDGKYFIFLGMANSIETAKLLSSNYKSNGAKDAFPKTFVINDKKISSLDEQERRFAEAIPGIYQSLADLTSTALSTDTISKDSMKKLADLANPLTMTNFKNEKVKELSSDLKNSMEKLNSYQKSKDTAALTAAQQDLLDFLAAYYVW